MAQIRKIHSNIIKKAYHIKFFNSCIGRGIIPKGLTTSLNIAFHVNDELFVNEFQTTLNEASSRGLDIILQKYVEDKEVLETLLDEKKVEAAQEMGNLNKEWTEWKLSYTISQNFSYVVLTKCTKKLGVLICPNKKLGEIDLPPKKVRATD